jgi:hypothetical protein
MLYRNGIKRATSLDGRALRYLDARQKACLGANLLGEPGQPFTLTLLANVLHVTPAYIIAARKLLPIKRDGILRGYDKTSFAPLLKKANGNGVIDDVKLLALVRTVGVSRVIDAACTVEAAE